MSLQTDTHRAPATRPTPVPGQPKPSRLGQFVRRSPMRLAVAVLLVIEIYPIRHEHDPRTSRREGLQNGLRKHDHSERLAAPLRMPHDTACASSVRPDVGNALKHCTHREVLLISRDFACTRFKHRIPPRELQESGRLTERIQQPVLFRGGPALRDLRHPPGTSRCGSFRRTSEPPD